MAENKNAKKAAAAAATSEESSPQEHLKKDKKKSRWTLEACMKASKRFNVREDWAHGHPSSYKAACARGWDADCCKHMTKSPVAKAVAKKPAAATTKAPAKKPRMPKAS